MQTFEDGPLESAQINFSPVLNERPAPIAPWWHTLVLIAGIALLSYEGASEFGPGGKGEAHVNRLLTYGSTAITELLMLGWVYIGLRLRKIPFKSLLGSGEGGLRIWLLDAGLAFLFWIGSLIVLGTVGMFWAVIDAAIHHRGLIPHAGKGIPPDPSQQHTIQTLTSLAPTSSHEVMAWVVLCCIAGLTEEVVFRGYLQRQFTAWARGALVAGVLGSALLFGAAHGYQGARNMVMLAAFGVLFSLLTLFRRGLRPAIMAHSWHDFIVGLALAYLKAHRLI